MARGYAGGRVGEGLRALFRVGPIGQDGDARLLDQFEGGEPGRSDLAFAALVGRHGPMVLGVCRRILGDPDLAEDAFQATFLILARRGRAVRDRDALAPWLHRVARRVATRARVRADRLRGRERLEAREVAVKHPDRVEGLEIRAIIDEEVDALGDHQRLPVILCCLEGLTHEEASARLAWPVGTVKSRLARGRLRLQARLARRGVTPGVAAASILNEPAEAAVPAALVDATVRLVVGSSGLGAVAAAVPAGVAFLVREEVGSMIAWKLRWIAGSLLGAGGSAALVGWAVAAGPAPATQEPRPTPATPGALPPPGRPPAVGTGRALLRVVDPAGRPVANAQVDLRDPGRILRPQPGRTDAEGRYTATGLPAGYAIIVDVAALDRSLGATAEIPGADEAGPDRRVQEIRLGPLVALAGRVVDDEGRPITDPAITLHRNVADPTHRGRSFGVPVATSKKPQIAGLYSFSGLIAGATYSTSIEARGYTRASTGHIEARPGRTNDLGDTVLIVANQAVDGVVVDSRGKPVAKVNVGLSRTERTLSLDAPAGATWFVDTDASGRFHLSGLPRGPIRLMAYRNTGGEIRDPKILDVPAGAAEIRIELPEPDEPLRGIE